MLSGADGEARPQAGASAATAGSPREPTGLVDRDAELERLDELLDDARSGTGRVVLVEGEAGIGKTALLRAVRERAVTAGCTVLRARGAELERDFPHGVVRQLYEAPLRTAAPERRRRLLEGAALLAAPVIGLEAPAARPAVADAAFAANHGVYWLTVALSDEAPLVLLVDDAHWVDSATLLFLDYLGQRWDELPVLVAVALRPAEAGASTGLLDALRVLPVAETLRPRLLGAAGSATLLEGFTQQRLPPDLARACHDATGGNPFLLKELVRALAADGHASDADVAERVRSLGPASISRSVLGRLARLWPEAVEMARAVAVLDTDAELRHVTKIAGLGDERAIETADALTAAGVLAPGRPLRFLHPIIRRAVYNDLGEARRAADHARVARIIDTEGGDPDRAAAHLLHTEPAADPWVADRLRAAADRALARGAPAAAAAHLRRALAEPPPPDLRSVVLLELGRAARFAGEADAFDLLSEALGTTRDIATRVEAAEELGLALAFFGDLERALEVLDRTAKDVVAEDRDGALRLEAAFLMISAWSDPTAARAEQRVDRLLAGVTGKNRTERMLLSGAAALKANSMSPGRKENLRIAELAARQDLLIEEGAAVGLSWVGPLGMLSLYDEEARCAKLFEAAFAHARRTGSRTELSTYWAMRARGAWVHGGRWGDLSDVEDCACRAADLAPSVGLFLRYHLAAQRAIALLERGHRARAAAVLDDYGVGDGDIAPVASGRTVLVVRAHLRAGGGRTKRARADAEEATRRAIERDTSYLWAGLGWSTALALRSAGAPPQEVLAEARRELAVARRFGSPGIEGIANIAVGIAESSERALEHFEAAVGLLDGKPRALDTARALVEYGSALRRANRRSEATDPLGRGMELAHRCGAQPLAQRAREELRMCGARPRRLVVAGVDSLTAAESRVARMAAEGMSNTEIAQALFVTRKTVETHLGHVYLKLQISSREDLPEALAPIDAEV